MTFAIRIAAAIAAALFVAIPANAQTILRSQTVSYDNIAALEAVPFARFATGAQVLLSDAGRAGLFVKVTSDQSALTTVDTAKCVFIPSPQDTDGSSGGWMRQDWLNTGAVKPQWCGLGASGNTATQNANAINYAEAVAGQVRQVLVTNKQATPYAYVSIGGGDYTVRPGIIENRHGVILDCGGAILRAESGQTGAVITNSYDGDSYTETNGAIVKNCYLFGDASANFAYDATAGQIGILTEANVRDGGCENVVATRFDTGYFYDGTFGFRHVNCSAYSSGSADADDMSAGLVIHAGTASYVQGGRFDYSNGTANIVVDGATNGATTGLQFFSVISQGANKRGLYATGVIDNLVWIGGDFENNDNGNNDVPDFEVTNSSARTGKVLVVGAQHIRTGADDDANGPAYRVNNVADVDINAFVRDQVTANYTSFLDATGTNGSYRISGRFQTNASSGTTAGVTGAGTWDEPCGGDDFVRYNINGAGFTSASRESCATTINATTAVLGGINLPDKSEVTIASGAITVSGSGVYPVDTEADAASDDLDTINGGTAGDLIGIHTVTSTRDVVVKYNTGDILVNGKADFTLTSPFDICFFRYGASKWNGMGCFDNF